MRSWYTARYVHGLGQPPPGQGKHRCPENQALSFKLSLQLSTLLVNFPCASDSSSFQWGSTKMALQMLTQELLDQTTEQSSSSCRLQPRHRSGWLGCKESHFAFLGCKETHFAFLMSCRRGVFSKASRLLPPRLAAPSRSKVVSLAGYPPT